MKRVRTNIYTGADLSTSSRAEFHCETFKSNNESERYTFQGDIVSTTEGLISVFLPTRILRDVVMLRGYASITFPSGTVLSSEMVSQDLKYNFYYDSEDDDPCSFCQYLMIRFGECSPRIDDMIL